MVLEDVDVNALELGVVDLAGLDLDAGSMRDS